MKGNHTAVSLLFASLLVLSVFSVGAAAAPDPGVESIQEDDTPEANETETEEPDYSVRGLSKTVIDASSPPSVRRWGDYGQLWLKHVPVSLMTTGNDPLNDSRYVRHYTTVERDEVYLGAYRGWNAPELNLTVHVVTWKEGTRVVNASDGGKRTERYPKNITETEVDVKLSGNGYEQVKIPLPEVYGERKHVTMWVDGKRSSTQWTFDLKTSKATQNINVGSLGGVIKWSVWNIFIWTVAIAAALVLVDAKVMRKVAKGPQWGALEYGFIGFATLFFSGVVFYSGVMNTLATRPQIIGVIGGLFLGGIMLKALSRPGQEALFLQPLPETGEVDTDGSGGWKWANRTHTVVERQKDGKKVIPRDGWIPFLARAYPFVDAVPVLEFDAAEARVLESPPDAVEFEDDAGRFERVRTRLFGSKGDGDAFDEIYLIDPMADHVIEYDEERFTLSMPNLVSWPDEDSGVWIRDVPLPSIAFGKIIGGIAAMVLVGAGVGAFLKSPGWGIVAGAAALLALVSRPVSGSARVELAPAHFDAVLANVTQSLEGWSEKADAEHYREKYHKTDARRRVERARETERDERTVFGEIAGRLAPEDRPNESERPGDAPKSPAGGDDD